VPDDSKISLLVVEDEEPIRTGLCDVLTFRGYRAESAATKGSSARATASTP